VSDPAAADVVTQAQDDDRVEAPEGDRVEVPATPLQARPVLVVDFGAQYAQLIARRVREANIYSEVVPHTASVGELLARDPAAIVLSGGPSSVYEEGAPELDKALLEAGVPVFGMCYGFQAMAQALGGTVAHTGLGEYGSGAPSS
jgi:GMP synthase (glutamine-hydrolysing)